MKLLLDLGASRIKCYLVDQKTVIQSASVASPSMCNHGTVKGQFIVPESLYRTTILKLLNSLYSAEVDSVYVCSEMHGFLIDDYYISWKDTRAKFSKEQADNFYKITGMTLRPGMAYATLEHENITNRQIGTLVDSFLDKPAEFVNISLASSLGFVDKHTQQYSDQLLRNRISPVTTDIKQQIGTVTVKSKSLPVYGGIGDLQSALLGTGLTQDDLVLNLGTGSQVVGTTESVDNYEIRPMPDGSYVKVITHIPCGRALNIVADKFGVDKFWQEWNNLTGDQVLNSDPTQANLSFFENAWQYSDSSGYIRFREHQSFQDLVASIAHSWLRQYVDVIELLDQKKQKTNIILSGGVSHKTEFVDIVLKNYCEKTFSKTTTITGEETIDGLLKL